MMSESKNDMTASKGCENAKLRKICLGLEKVSTTIYPGTLLYYLLTIYCTIYLTNLILIKKSTLGRELENHLGRQLVSRQVDSFQNVWVDSTGSFWGEGKGREVCLC